MTLPADVNTTADAVAPVCPMVMTAPLVEPDLRVKEPVLPVTPRNVGDDGVELEGPSTLKLPALVAVKVVPACRLVETGKEFEPSCKLTMPVDLGAAESVIVNDVGIAAEPPTITGTAVFVVSLNANETLALCALFGPKA